MTTVRARGGKGFPANGRHGTVGRPGRHFPLVDHPAGCLEHARDEHPDLGPASLGENGLVGDDVGELARHGFGADAIDHDDADHLEA